MNIKYWNWKLFFLFSNHQFTNRWNETKNSPFVLYFLFSRLPFDWKTPCGYSAATYSLVISIVPIALFFVGAFILFITFIKDITNDVNNLKKLTKKSQKTERMQLFRHIVKDFSDLKQLSVKCWSSYRDTVARKGSGLCIH